MCSYIGVWVMFSLLKHACYTALYNNVVCIDTKTKLQFICHPQDIDMIMV